MTPDESWADLSPHYPGHAVSTLGRVKQLQRQDKAGKTRQERILKVMYQESRKFPATKAKQGFVRLVHGDTVSFVFVADLMALAHFPEFDREFHTVAYRDLRPDHLRLDNIYIVPKFVAKIDRKLASAGQRLGHRQQHVFDQQ